MFRMLKKLKVWLGVFSVVALLLLCTPAVALGATSATVTVDATPQYVSISLNNSTYDFGVVAASATPNTAGGYFGITNSSNVETDNTIVSNGWEGGDNDWTWGASGEDTALLNASDGDEAYDVEVDDTTPATLKAAVAAETDWEFELQLECPSSFTYPNAQSTTITIAASAT